MRSILMCFIVIPLLIMPTASVLADDVAIAILNFELNDLTLNPNTADELERTASIKPLLNETLISKYGYKIVVVNSEIQENADAGFGYLFDHHDVAAQLGRDAGAEWVIVGRVHKPSFLFVYFMAHVINAKTGQLIGNLIVEVKGPQRKLTIRGVESLAERIAETIQRGG
jgi:hypothetical protein